MLPTGQDHRPRAIVAEAAVGLKDEMGGPAHALPAHPDERAHIARSLERFGEPLPPTGETEVAVRLAEGASLADVVRGLDAEGLAIADIELRAPTLDDVFLAKTGRSLEGSGEETVRGGAEDEDAPIRAIVQR